MQYNEILAGYTFKSLGLFFFPMFLKDIHQFIAFLLNKSINFFL